MCEWAELAGRLHVSWVRGRQRRYFLGMGLHVSTHSAFLSLLEVVEGALSKLLSVVGRHGHRQQSTR